VIEAEKASFPVRMMCRVLKVSPSGCYAWRQRERSPRERVDEALGAEIVEIHEAGRGTYGSPRIQSDLSARGHRTSRKRVARLMRESSILRRIRRRFVRTTDSDHPHPIAPNRLGRDFAVAGPDQCWVGDISVPQQAAVGGEG
jgi:transposase InsO family protein